MATWRGAGRGRDGGDVLVEREAELAAIEDAAERAGKGAGSVLLVEGPSGIGKTKLMQAAKEAASRHGLRPLSARCAALEADFTFGVVRQLFEPVLAAALGDERDGLLAGAAALAAPVFATVAPAASATTEILLAVLNGLYWLTSNLAEGLPLLLLVDDAQWSDTASLRFCEFLARRIDELPVLMAIAAGPGNLAAPESLLLQIAASPGSQRLRPQSLGDGGIAELAESALHTPPQPGFLSSCRDVTGGNPFLVRELLSELQRLSLTPTDDQADAVRRLGPRPVAQWLQLRLAALPAAATELARAVAVLEDPTDLSIAGALAGLEPPEAGPSADALAATGILAPDPPLRFRHSILRTSVYADLPAAARRAAHRRAAELHAARGASPEQVAAHLLRADPQGDGFAVATLRAAAARAMATGAPDAAATYLRRALAEPPALGDRGPVLVEFCTAAARQASPDSFDELRRQMQLVADPRQRAEIALELARGIGMVADTGGALEVLDRALQDLGETDSEVGLRLVADLISVARLHADTRVPALQRLRQLKDLAKPGDLAGAVLLANLALDMVERGQPAAEAVALAEQALSGGTLLAEERWVYAYAANTLLWADDVERARRAWTEAFDRSNLAGSVSMAHLAAVWRSHLAFRTGDLADAEADARVGLNISRQHHWTFSGSYALAFLIDVLLERNELEMASALAAETQSPRPLHYLLDSLGRLRCAQGRLEEGLALLLECGTQLEAQGGGGNPAVIAWRSSAALALAGLGRMGDARQLADEEVQLARAFGAPRAIGVALRARALTDTGDGRIALLDEALGFLERSPARLEHARALADRAAASRRAGNRADAEDRFRQAMELAHRCGALGLRGRIRDELLRSGLRPRRFATSGVDALTASERRTAALAASGLGNREIAQALYVSLKTVEAHLSSVYRKLGVTARSQLADRMAAVRPAGS